GRERHWRSVAAPARRDSRSSLFVAFWTRHSLAGNVHQRWSRRRLSSRGHLLRAVRYGAWRHCRKSTRRVGFVSERVSPRRRALREETARTLHSACPAARANCAVQHRTPTGGTEPVGSRR